MMLHDRRRLGARLQNRARLISDQGADHYGQFKVIVEKHLDGYVAYPLGLKGVVVGEGNTYEEALADVKSAIRFHIETFGQDVFETESPFPI
jgi:predicted RNase H-like HicB family nuclease